MSDTGIQALGFLAFAINLTAASTVNDNRMRALICLSCLIFSAHYMLMGALVAGVNLLVNSFRALVSLKFKGKTAFTLFMFVQAAMSFYFYSEPADLLPAAASLISCYALFLAEGMRMRIAFLFCTLLWLSNAFVVGSYGGLINDMFNTLMLSFTIFRLSRKKQQAAVCTSN